MFEWLAAFAAQSLPLNERACGHVKALRILEEAFYLLIGWTDYLLAVLLMYLLAILSTLFIYWMQHSTFIYFLEQIEHEDPPAVIDEMEAAHVVITSHTRHLLVKVTLLIAIQLSSNVLVHQKGRDGKGQKNYGRYYGS